MEWRGFEGKRSESDEKKERERVSFVLIFSNEYPPFISHNISSHVLKSIIV